MVILKLLNLHWLGDSTLSIEEIGRLPCPVLWTLHDQWPFSGAEHYAPLPGSGSDLAALERFTSGYERQTTPALERTCDLNRWTWQRKHRSWRQANDLDLPQSMDGGLCSAQCLDGGLALPCHPESVESSAVVPN